MSIAFNEPRTVRADYRLYNVRHLIVFTKAEREASFKLVYSAYLKRGIGTVNRYKMRVTPYHLLGTTEVFYAELDGEVVLTMTLVRDGKLGLPMESVYAKEVGILRNNGCNLAEVSCLADQQGLMGKYFLPVFIGLNRLLAQYASKHGVGVLVAAIHPHHAPFYERVLGFEKFGPHRTYPNVANRSAVAIMIDFNFVRLYCPRCYGLFFDKPIPEKWLQSTPISEEQKKHFAPMVDSFFGHIA